MVFAAFNDPALYADQLFTVRSEPRAEMNARYPVDVEGQAIAPAAVDDEELAVSTPSHAIEVLGETSVSVASFQIWSGPSEPLVCTEAIDTEPIPTTSVAATKVMPIARKDFFFIICFPLSIRA
jgi:hypothetical protein